MRSLLKLVEFAPEDEGLIYDNKSASLVNDTANFLLNNGSFMSLLIKLGVAVLLLLPK